VFFNQDITRDNRALGDAFAAALYLVDRYRRVHEGRPVRDLDEAESSLATRLSRIAIANDNLSNEETDERRPSV
jgi:hypothetical protein